MPDSSNTCPPLPLVVQVGFSGSRRLLPHDTSLQPAQREDFARLIQERLVQCLSGLPARLGLQPHHFLSSISQLAIGADTLFTRACAALPISQQLFLPQTCEEFLGAVGSDGTPDFTPAEQAVAHDLLALPHLIHERVVSHAHSRSDRFEEANLAILRASDVCLCLIRADAGSKAGGARSFLSDAQMFQKPVLEIQVSEQNGLPIFQETWHASAQWAPPGLPHDLAGATGPAKVTSLPPGIPIHVQEFLDAIKSVGSRLAQWKQTTFRLIALIVIAAHLLATLCAVLALVLGHGAKAVPWLLGLELILLATGYLVHRCLHHSHTIGVWAISRLAAEIARSVSALSDLHVNLDYLFTLPFPATFRPLLETTNLLHLASHRHSSLAWQDKCKHYLAKRFDDPKGGQLGYYQAKLMAAQSRLRLASFTFEAATMAAFLFTTAKLALHLGEHSWHGQLEEGVPTILGGFAILLPVVAVGALSLASSFDLEARAHTYTDTWEFFQRTRPLLAAVRSKSAFVHLVLETESRLLGETANWFSRRSFTSIN